MNNDILKLLTKKFPWIVDFEVDNQGGTVIGYGAKENNKRQYVIHDVNTRTTTVHLDEYYQTDDDEDCVTTRLA